MSLILKGFESDALVEQINNSPSKRLIHEIHYKYGLKVFQGEENKFWMCEPDTGFAVAKVWTSVEGDEITYNYRSPFYYKERGRNTADRETIHSKKLSTLMGTLKRQNVVPNVGHLIRHHSDSWMNGKSAMEESFGRADKSFSNLGADQIHALLQKVLGVSPNTKTYELDTNICQELLDKFTKVDRIKEEKQREVNRFFENEFWCVGADNNDHLIVGSAKQVGKEFQIVKPFKRVRNLDEYEDLKPIMLMMKVHMQDKTDRFTADTIPQVRGFLSDLDVVIALCRMVDDYNFVWALTPCSTPQA